MEKRFSNRIQELRLSKNLNRKEFATLLKVEESEIAKWEENLGYPENEEFQRISDVFKIPVDDLISDVEIKTGVVNIKKKNFKRKFIISLSIIFSLLLIVFLSLTIMYRPRKISSYIKSNSEDFIKIEVVNYDENVVYYNNENLDNDFLKEILDVKVVPNYKYNYKVVSSYKIILYYTNCEYRIDNYHINDEKNVRYFTTLNNAIYQLVKKYTGGIA